MAVPPSHDKTLLRLMVFATALSFGILAAALVSTKDFIHGDASFQFSWRTLVAFGVGCVAGWAFWRIVLWLNRQRGARRK